MKIIGHRGAKGLAPENTIASLLKALEHGVDEIEFDVRITKDGVVILQHDQALHDPGGAELTVSAHTFEELKAHKSDLATLDEAINAVNGRVPLLVEVKPGVSTPPIVSVIETALEGSLKDTDLLLGSFSQQILLELHEALPTIQKVVIEPWSGVRAVHRARKVGTKRLNMNQRWLWRGFIKPMQKSGWELYPYTLNSVSKAKKWQRYGLSGIITDYPDRFEK